MGALLTGVKRAYVYSTKDEEMFSQHIETIFKLVHLSPPNVAIDALALLHLVASFSSVVSDR